MASRPVAIPEVFTGEGGQTWSDWRDHFDSMAEVNGWSAADKKKWVRARLTGRAATAMRRLSEDDKASFDTICAAMNKRFKPECRKEVFMAEFQTKKKRRNEDWASFAEDLKILAEKAYPTLQAEAQELLALNNFLNQIEDQQLSFAVRQRAPVMVDAAVAAVLELETYLKLKQMETHTSGVTAGVSHQQQPREDLLMKIMERLDRIETQIVPKGNNDQGMMRAQCRREGPITCWNCKEEGHISRNCPEKSGAEKKQTFAAVNWATKNTRKTGTQQG